MSYYTRIIFCYSIRVVFFTKYFYIEVFSCLARLCPLVPPRQPYILPRHILFCQDIFRYSLDYARSMSLLPEVLASYFTGLFRLTLLRFLGFLRYIRTASSLYFTESIMSLSFFQGGNPHWKLCTLLSSQSSWKLVLGKNSLSVAWRQDRFSSV